MQTILKISFFTIHFWLFIPICVAQNLYPAYLSEIIIKENIVYFNGSKFTGIIIDDKTKKTLGEARNGYKQGYFIELHPNGKVKNEGAYDYGSKNGLHKEWYENGILKSQGEYVGGKLNGLYIKWSETGNKQFEIMYSNGLKEGSAKEYYSNGNLKATATFISGNPEGIITNYYQNGNKQLETSMINGKYNGKYIEWHENGSLKVEYQYKYGSVVDGKYFQYNSLGEKEKELSYNNGKLNKENVVRNGSLYEWHTEYFSGEDKIKLSGMLRDGLKDSLWTTWYETGQIRSQCNYANNQLNGNCVEWYYNGTKKREAVYNNGILSLLLYENNNDPAYSIRNKMEHGNYLFKSTSNIEDDTLFFMVDLDFNQSQLNDQIKKNILVAIDKRFDYISIKDTSYYSDRQLRYRISFKNPQFYTVFDEGNAIVNVLLAAANTAPASGYRGRLESAVEIYDMISNKILYAFNTVAQTEIYPTNNEASKNIASVNFIGLTQQLQKIYRPKANVSALDYDKKGRIKTVNINKGISNGFYKKYTLEVYEKNNLKTLLGYIEVDTPYESTSVCKVTEGPDLITTYLKEGKKLVGILSKNIIQK